MVRIINHFRFLYQDIIKALQAETWIKAHLIGGRWAGKTKSLLIVLSQLLFINDTNEHKDKVIQVNWFRQDVYSADENFTGFCDTLDELGVKDKVYLHKTKRLAVYKHVQVRFVGYETSSRKAVAKLGMNRLSNVALLVNVFEEIFEFKGRRDIDKINQAVGGGKSVINYFLTNPWDENHWYLFDLSGKLAKCNLEFNPKAMDERGYNHFFLGKDEYLSWTNHRVNEYLSNITHQQLLKYWEYDPQQARIVERGEMGVVSGGIYTNALKKWCFTPPKDLVVDKLWMGVDIGVSRDATAFSLVGVCPQGNKFMVLNEYYHSHQTQRYQIDGKIYPFRPFNQVEYVKEIVFYAKMWSEQYNLPVQIFIDYSSNLVSFVREEIIKQRLSEALVAFPCSKIKLNVRIDTTIYLLLNQRLFIHPQRCVHLVREMRSSTYDTNLQKRYEHAYKGYNLTRNDGNDHVLNAFEYAMGRSFFSLRDASWNTITFKEKEQSLWHNPI